MDQTGARKSSKAVASPRRMFSLFELIFVVCHLDTSDVVAQQCVVRGQGQVSDFITPKVPRMTFNIVASQKTLRHCVVGLEVDRELLEVSHKATPCRPCR